MRLHFLFIVLFSIFLVACRKECQYKNLPSIECSDGYELVNGTVKYFVPLFHDVGIREFVINSDSAYLNHFNGSMPYGDIDFDASTLLIRHLLTSPADEWKYQYYLCHNAANNTWKFNVEYSLGGQCQGSQISNFAASFILLCPKIPGSDFVVFEVKDINPFPD